MLLTWEQQYMTTVGEEGIFFVTVVSGQRRSAPVSTDLGLTQRPFHTDAALRPSAGVFPFSQHVRRRLSLSECSPRPFTLFPIGTTIFTFISHRGVT